MFYVYVLQSTISSYRYVGSTQDVSIRLQQHNEGLSISTKHHAPFVIIYIEEYHTISEALKQEKRYKTGVGRDHLKQILSTRYVN